MASKIRMLMFSADPRDVRYRPFLKKEFRQIKESIDASSNRGLFKLRSEWSVRPNDLQGALLKYQPHIVHFSSHGKEDVGIVLEDDEGLSKPVSASALADLLHTLKDEIRIVFINTCYSANLLEPLWDIIDYTIGMKTSVSDEGAIIFAASFYGWLARGLSVSKAFKLAINRLELENNCSSQTPILFVRQGVNGLEPFLKQFKKRSQTSRIKKAHKKVDINSLTSTSQGATQSPTIGFRGQRERKRKLNEINKNKAGTLKNAQLIEVIEELKLGLDRLATLILNDEA